MKEVEVLMFSSFFWSESDFLKQYHKKYLGYLENVTIPFNKPEQQ